MTCVRDSRPHSEGEPIPTGHDRREPSGFARLLNQAPSGPRRSPFARGTHRGPPVPIGHKSHGRRTNPIWRFSGCHRVHPPARIDCPNTTRSTNRFPVGFRPPRTVRLTRGSSPGQPGELPTTVRSRHSSPGFLVRGIPPTTRDRNQPSARQPGPVEVRSGSPTPPHLSRQSVTVKRPDKA